MVGKTRISGWLAFGLALAGVLGAEAQDLQIRGKIVFTSTRDLPNDENGWEIYTMNGDGSGLSRLTNNKKQDYSDGFSPDGAKILYLTNRDGNFEAYSMSAMDGSGATRLTTNSASDGYGAWSPDGTKIAFFSDRDGVSSIYAMNADGSGVVRLTTGPGDNFPSWSPDGAKIAFESSRSGNNEIWVMNADGSGQTNLTNNAAADAGASWSPDGTSIAFDSSRDGNNEIYVMDASGATQIRLTNNTAHDGRATWSPEGTRICFGSNRDGNGEVYTMNADGSGQTRLTAESQGDNSQSWEQFRLIGTTTSGTSVSRAMTIENKGSATLTVSNITSSDGLFTISPTSFSLAAGSNQNITITFTPTSTGTKYTTLTITSNDAETPVIALIVNGTGSTGSVSSLLGDRSLMADLSSKTRVTISGNTTDRRTAVVRNTTRTALTTPLLLVVERITPSSVTVANADGMTTPDGKPFFNLASVITGGSLAANRSARSLTIRFNNARRVRFAVTAKVYQQTAAGKWVAIEEVVLPEVSALGQNYPNPFNPSTEIPFALTQAGEVSLKIFNLLGQQVRELAQGHREAGMYHLRWDGRDDQGRAVAGGVYIYQLALNGATESRRLLLMK